MISCKAINYIEVVPKSFSIFGTNKLRTDSSSTVKIIKIFITQKEVMWSRFTCDLNSYQEILVRWKGWDNTFLFGSTNKNDFLFSSNMTNVQRSIVQERHKHYSAKSFTLYCIVNLLVSEWKTRTSMHTNGSVTRPVFEVGNPFGHIVQKQIRKCMVEVHFKRTLDNIRDIFYNITMSLQLDLQMLARLKR